MVLAYFTDIREAIPMRTVPHLRENVINIGHARIVPLLILGASPNVSLRILLIWRVILPRRIRARLTNILKATVGLFLQGFGVSVQLVFFYFPVRRLPNLES